MLALLISAAAVTVPQASVTGRAEATITVLSPVFATKADWEKSPPERRREIVGEENGHKTTIRVIEYE
jgi:hypothetical protein